MIKQMFSGQFDALGNQFQTVVLKSFASQGPQKQVPFSVCSLLSKTNLKDKNYSYWCVILGSISL